MTTPELLPVSVATAPHYAWGEACHGWHLVESPELSVIQEQMPDATSEVRHRHHRARQFFYVLRGRLTIELVNGALVLTPGTGLEVPPLLEHRAFNNSGEPVEFLVISQPPSHGDREPLPAA